MFQKVFDRLGLRRSDKADGAGEISAALLQLTAADWDVLAIPGLEGEASQVVLDQPLVDLRLDPGATGGKMDAAAAKEIGGNRPIWDFLRATRLEEVSAFAVVGPPGCGKTSLLKHVALTLARGRHERVGCRPYLPVYLPLTTLKTALSQTPTLAGLLALHLGNPERFPDLELPKGWIDKQIEAGRFLLLLDGMDELGELPQRAAAAKWIARNIEAHPRCRFLIASRPGAYREVKMERPRLLEVQPLRGEQVRRFVEAYCIASEAASRGGKEDPGARQNALKKAADLLAALRRTPALMALSSSPLLLAALTRVHSQLGGLPGGSRAALLQHLVTTLAGFWNTSGGLSTSQKLAVLRPLAEFMMRRKARELRKDDMLKLLATLLQGTSATPEAVLADILRSGALLMEQEPGRYRFIHAQVQEYLAAAQMAHKADPGRRFETLVGDTFFHEMLTLLAAQADGTPIVSACLSGGTVPALSLASEILDESSRIAPPVRAQAEAVLKTALSSSDVKARHLATEVKLFRRLKGLQRMDELREIDLTYITVAEYHMFLDDMRARGHSYQPDHWPSQMPPPGLAETPITGVRGEDGRDFCLWLSMKVGGNARFRLPRPEEARAFPAAPGDVATLCRDADSYTLTGLAPKTEQAIMAQLSQLPLGQIPSTLPLERCLKRDVDVSFNRALLRSLELNVDPLVERALFRSLDNVREMVLSRSFELVSVISPDLDLARTLARADTMHPHLALALDRGDLDEAQRLAEEIRADALEGDAAYRFATLLMAILEAARADEGVEVQAAQRRYLAIMASCVYDTLGTDESIPAPQRRQAQQEVAEFGAWLQMVMARASGRLAAWEGIRIVRDQSPVDKAQALDLPAWAYNA